MKKLKINWGEFQDTLEGFESITGDEIARFLDTETGEIHILFPDSDDYDELCERMEADSGERYLHVERRDSHETFRIMENFALSLPESPPKSRLLDALSRNKPFRRFKDVVDSDLAWRNQWFVFRDLAHKQYAGGWLQSHGIEPEWIGL